MHIYIYTRTAHARTRTQIHTHTHTDRHTHNTCTQTRLCTKGSKALFVAEWATEKAERPITRKEFILCINKCASNKRKYRIKKKKSIKYYTKKRKN